MSKPNIRLDFWNKSFFKETAFGRTLSGRNKTGQTLGVIKDTALSTVPFVGKPLAEATGRITEALEAEEIGKRVDDLNLPRWAILTIRGLTIAVLGYLLLNNVIGWEEAQQLLELVKQAGMAG